MNESPGEIPQQEVPLEVPQDVVSLAELLDSKFQTPFGKVGWDGIIGLIPGFGDFATTLLSCYIIARAALLGVSVSTLLRMGLNVLIDNGISLIPVAGWIGDFYWRSNLMNVELIRGHLADPRGTSRRSAGVVGLILGLVLGFTGGTAVIAGYFVWKATGFLLGLF